jgi:hypothetical protein
MAGSSRRNAHLRAYLLVFPRNDGGHGSSPGVAFPGICRVSGRLDAGCLVEKAPQTSTSRKEALRAHLDLEPGALARPAGAAEDEDCNG